MAVSATITPFRPGGATRGTGSSPGADSDAGPDDPAELDGALVGVMVMT
jgi:hypothetical protein